MSGPWPWPNPTNAEIKRLTDENAALRDALREIVDTARLIAGGSPGSLDQVELDWDDIMAASDVLRRLRGDA